jgi:uncharacterized protein (UPF0297 family)
MAQTDFEKQITAVITALSDAGYDPYAQLTGYVQTGDDTYITRKGNARTITQTLDRELIAKYLVVYHQQQARKDGF